MNECFNIEDHCFYHIYTARGLYLHDSARSWGKSLSCEAMRWKISLNFSGEQRSSYHIMKNSIIQYRILDFCVVRVIVDTVECSVKGERDDATFSVQAKTRFILYICRISHSNRYLNHYFNGCSSYWNHHQPHTLVFWTRASQILHTLGAYPV